MNRFTKQTYRYWKETYGYQKGNIWGGGYSGAWDEHTYTTAYKIDDQQGPTVYHREL